MDSQEKEKRQRIQALLREAASLFSGTTPPDLDPALPMLHSAVQLAESLPDKTPLLICQSNLAHMHAVCGRAGDAFYYIDRAIRTAMDGELAVPVRNFVFIKFIEIAVLLRREHKRALTYGRALVQSAVDEDDNPHQFYAAVHNLAVLCQDLLKCPDWSLALCSWLEQHAPADHPLGMQAGRLSTRIVARFPAETRHAWQAEVEANRDALACEAFGGWTPDVAVFF